MTIKQKQSLLFYLGYYTGNVDGAWGAQSIAATRDFQSANGLTVDGSFGTNTEKKIKEAVANDGFKKTTTAATTSSVTTTTTTTTTATSNAQSTGTFWDEIKYFKRSEFACQCGGKYCNGFPIEMDETAVKYADEIRRRIGKSLNVNSAIRDTTHNINVGGVDGSYHTKGKAIDLGCPSGYTPQQMYTIAEQVIGDKGGVGLYSWGIHIDSRGYKSRFTG